MSTTSDGPVAEPHLLRVLLTLAWPIVLSRATQSVIGFTDALMVAPLGEAALAATTTGAMDVLSLVLLPIGTAFILQSFAAQLRGRGELAALRRYARYGFVLAAVAQVVALALLPAVPWLVSLLDYEPAVAEPMTEYLVVRIFSIGAVVGTEALGNWYGGLGNTRMAMGASVVTMCVNVVGNYLLIEPRFGLPGYGPLGAGLASAFASFVGFGAISLAYLRGIGFDLPDGDRRMRASEFARVLRFGLPNGVNWMLEFAAFAVFLNVVVGGLGTTALAAMNVVIQINSVAFMPAFGVASAGAILVGEAIGRKDLERVPKVVGVTLAVAATWMAAVGVVNVTIPRTILSWFTTEAESGSGLLVVGASMLVLSVAWQLFDAVGITLGEALRAAGDTTWCMFARTGLAWVFFVPVAYVTVHVQRGGATAAILSLTAYLVALSFALGYRFRVGRWRTLEMVGEPDLLV